MQDAKKPDESTADLQAIHEKAMDGFNLSYEACSEVRKMCFQDRRFYSVEGAQWEDEWGQLFENKPRLECDETHIGVMRIISDYRSNQIVANFVSKDGEDADSLADACDGIYRADGQDSLADEARDTAFEEAAGGGFGAWRLRAVYEDEYDEENEHQRIIFEGIPDADLTVFFDANSKTQNKSDAKECWVITPLTHTAYEEKYGHSVSSFDKVETPNTYDWCTPDRVRIAEYYRVDEQDVEIYYYKTVLGEEEKYKEDELTAEKLEELKAVGSTFTRKRKVKSRVVRKYIIDGARVLEECGIIAGKYIPIIATYGKRWFIDGVEYCSGHVRKAKDMQRLQNMQFSKAAEIAALPSHNVPIFLQDQVINHSNVWGNAAQTNPAYLTIDAASTDSGQDVIGPVGYTKPPEMPQATAMLLQVAGQKLRDIMGNQDQGQQVRSNVSGDAVEQIHERIDQSTAIYLQNFAKAVQWEGTVWLSMANELYVEDGRKMKSIGPQGEVDSLVLNQPDQTTQGVEIRANDLSKAVYDVAVEVGPQSNTRRQAIVRSLLNILPRITDPNEASVIIGVILQNMEGEGLVEVQEYYRKKNVKRGVSKPTKEDEAEMAKEQQNAQPDAAEELLRAEARKADADIDKIAAESERLREDTELKAAQKVKTLAEIEDADRQFALNAAQVRQNTAPA